MNFWVPNVVKETVRVHEKHELKVWFRENLILRILKMMKVRENQSINFKNFANLAKIRKITKFDTLGNLFP